MGIGGTLQVPVGAVDDLFADQQVGHVLRAAEPGFQQVTPAPANLPQPGLGPVSGEDRLPLPGDELLPAESRHILWVMVIHVRQTMGRRLRPGSGRASGAGALALVAERAAR